MNIVMKIAMIGIMMNLATGIMIEALPGVFSDPTNRGGITYDAGFASDIIEQSNTSLSSDSEVSDSLSSNILQIDFLGIGAIKRTIDMIQSALYGFSNMLDIIFGTHMTTGLRALIFGQPLGFFPMITVIGYALFAFNLFTGRKVND